MCEYVIRVRVSDHQPFDWRHRVFLLSELYYGLLTEEARHDYTGSWSQKV